MDEPQYAALSFSLTRAVLPLKEAALDSLLKTGKLPTCQLLTIQMPTNPENTTYNNSTG